MQSWLYDISERINALVSVLDEADDKCIEPDVKNALTGIYESDVPAAVADGIAYIKGQKALIDAMSEEIKRLQSVKKARENRLARVRKGYGDFLEAIGKKKIETERGTMTTKKTPWRTVEDDVDKIPDVYKVQTITVKTNTESVKQAILTGHEIPGVHLEQHNTIEIK